MKTKPLLFTTEMVEALLSGVKTQTRRVLKPQPILKGSRSHGYWQWKECAWTKSKPHCVLGDELNIPIDHSPYGNPGDLLWVKETWMPYGQSYGYKAGSDPEALMALYYDGHRWKSPLFMSRQKSRITLELTSVTIQQAKDITEEDIIACGTNLKYSNGVAQNPYEQYAKLWKSINGKDSWKQNPWVWVLGFKVHKINVDKFLKRIAA